MKWNLHRNHQDVARSPSGSLASLKASQYPRAIAPHRCPRTALADRAVRFLQQSCMGMQTLRRSSWREEPIRTQRHDAASRLSCWRAEAASMSWPWDCSNEVGGEPLPATIMLLWTVLGGGGREPSPPPPPASFVVGESPAAYFQPLFFSSHLVVRALPVPNPSATMVSPRRTTLPRLIGLR